MHQAKYHNANRELLGDSELAFLASQRDETAARVLTKRYNRRLYRVARSILRDNSEAEDVVQETYIRALTHLESFRADASFGTWLTRIAMNEALGRLRRRRQTVDWDAHSESRIQAKILQFPLSARTADPEQAMAQKEVHRLLEDAIDTLPINFRIVFVARMVEGMSIEETAQALNLKAETVKTRLHRARRLLRKKLETQVGSVLAEAFSFDGARCDRLTNAVLQRLKQDRLGGPGTF